MNVFSTTPNRGMGNNTRYSRDLCTRFRLCGGYIDKDISCIQHTSILHTTYSNTYITSYNILHHIIHTTYLHHTNNIPTSYIQYRLGTHIIHTYNILIKNCQASTHLTLGQLELLNICTYSTYMQFTMKLDTL